MRKIRKLNGFLKNSKGGQEVDSPWTLIGVLEFMNFSIFDDFWIYGLFESSLNISWAKSSKMDLSPQTEFRSDNKP